MVSFLTRLGHLNPQYLRECRGRLKSRSVVAAIVLSLLFQGLLWLSIVNSYPNPDGPSDLLKLCRALSQVIPYALLALGGYYIVDDLTQEAKTGTLNFIRLSPRPAREILFGKLLGVPILPMVLVATMIPAHVFSGISAGVSPWLLLSYYIVVSAGAVVVFMLALLAGLGSGTAKLTQQRGVSSIAFAGITLFSIVPLFMVWNNEITWKTIATNSLLSRSWNNEEEALRWMLLNISQNTLFAHLFVLGNLAIVALLIWRTAVRKFRVPQATLLSRPISYWSTLYLNIVIWGFVSNIDFEESFDLVAVLYFLNAFSLLAMMLALSPSRQQLLDWVSDRTRRENSLNSQTGSQARKSTSSLWKSLIWSDISPSIGAIALNFLLAAIPLVPAAYIFGQNRDYYGEILPNVTPTALLFTTIVIALSALTYATLVQVIFSSRLRAPLVWAVGSIATLAIVPPLALAFLNMLPKDSPMLAAIWTFLGIPMMETAAYQVPPAAWVGVLGQLCFLMLLLNRLNRIMKRLKAQVQTQVQDQTLRTSATESAT